MRYLLFLLLIFVCGCSLRQPPPVEEQLKNKDEIIKKYDEKLQIAEQKQKDAKNDLERLKGEKEELTILRNKHLAEARLLEQEIKSKEKEIVKERQEMIKTKLYWLAGICIFFAALAFGISFWLPLFRKRALTFAVVLIGIAGTAYFLAWLIPYLIFIGIGIVAIGAIYAILYWFRDHKTVEEVVSAIEPVKNQISNYKEHFRTHISKSSDTLINKIRERKKKAEDKITTQIIKK